VDEQDHGVDADHVRRVGGEVHKEVELRRREEGEPEVDAGGDRYLAK